MASTHLQREVNEVNQSLQEASQPGVGLTLKRIRVGKALAGFRRLESRSISTADLGYVKGYILLAQCRILGGLCEGELGKQDRAELLFHLEEALAIWAWLYAHPEHHYQRAECTTQFSQILNTIFTWRRNSPNRQDLLHGLQGKLNKAHRACKDPLLVGILCETTHTILQECLDRAQCLFRDGKWAPAMSLLQSKDAELDVFVELEEKLKDNPNSVSGGLGYSLGEAQLQREEYTTLLAMCKCSQLVHFGDLHFKEALNGDPGDMLARGLLAQDDYRAAHQFAVGHDIEQEGTTLVRLALFHAKISKVPYTAHQLYLRAVQLATTLSPRQPQGRWYSESVDAVQAYRNAKEAEEAKKWENARKPILEKLSEEITKLEGARNMNNVEFVKFVFKTWPPKTEGGLEPPENPDDPNTLSKKNLLKVIQRYHVDKNAAWGDEWRVLSEEISKALTGRYNDLKGI